MIWICYIRWYSTDIFNQYIFSTRQYELSGALTRLRIFFHSPFFVYSLNSTWFPYLSGESIMGDNILRETKYCIDPIYRLKEKHHLTSRNARTNSVISLVSVSIFINLTSNRLIMGRTNWINPDFYSSKKWWRQDI